MSCWYPGSAHCLFARVERMRRMCGCFILSLTLLLNSSDCRTRLDRATLSGEWSVLSVCSRCKDRWSALLRRTTFGGLLLSLLKSAWWRWSPACVVYVPFQRLYQSASIWVKSQVSDLGSHTISYPSMVIPGSLMAESFIRKGISESPRRKLLA